MIRRAVGVAILWFVAACDTGASSARAARSDTTAPDSTVLAAREQKLEKAMARRDSDPLAHPLAQWRLPEKLKEISGLTLTPDGRLFAHGDERGRVFEIDYRRGVVVKEFSAGTPPVTADFEGITMAADTIVLLASEGVLYEFFEGANGKGVEYTTHDTGLEGFCEFEGVVRDSNSYLLACKVVHDKALKGSVVIYRWPSPPSANKLKPAAPPALVIPVSRIKGSNGWESLHPSDITIDPASGNYVLLAAREKVIFEVTRAGEVVFARELPDGHSQPEGIAITKDGVLIISDEARTGPALITLYRWPPGGLGARGRD